VAKIVTQNDCDSLEGVQLKDGDHAYIRWPSGTVEQVELFTEVVMRGSLKNGDVIEVPIRKAYIKVSVLGAVAKIYVNGFEAQLRR